MKKFYLLIELAEKLGIFLAISLVRLAPIPPAIPKLVWVRALPRLDLKNLKKLSFFGFFPILILFFIFGGGVFATELQGGVSFNVDSARDYLQEAQTDSIEISGPYNFKNSTKVQKKVYSYNNNGDVIGITVQYKKDSDKAYIYGRDNNLIYVDKYDKSVDIYPHRGYRYNLEGKLILSSLTVSKTEQFRFSPEGKLIAHSINGVIYDENGNVIGTGK